MSNPVLLLLLFFVALASAAFYEELYEEVAKQYEEENGGWTWQPGFNDYFRGKSEAEMKALLGARMPNENSEMKVKKVRVKNNLPDSFDSRKHWPKCKWMRFIRDQAACGSCWAVSAASAMSDRHCVASNSKEQPYVSDQNIVSCCTTCGYGCSGGYPDEAWTYWTRKGVPTGGPYGSKFGCQPYLVKPDAPGKPTPPCSKKCIPEYYKSLEKSKLYGNSSYLVDADEDQIKQEIYDHGPVVATMTVYWDFLHYKKGVYQHKSQSIAGYHAVRMIGWGEDKLGTKYWLITNSWNTTWGDQGLFSILRGVDECGIESGISAGLPRSSKHLVA